MGGELYTALPRSLKAEPHNLVLIKLPKAASSTSATLVERIAHNAGLTKWQPNTRAWNESEPGYWVSHDKMEVVAPRLLGLSMPSLLIASVREPIALAMSFHYAGCFHQARRITGKSSSVPAALFARYEQIVRQDTTEDKVRYLSTRRNYQYEYLRGRRGQNVESVLRQYDLVIVAEAMDKSAVLLSGWLGVRLTNVMYQSSKLMWHPSVAQEPEPVRNYLAREFSANNTLDIALHRLARASLESHFAALPNSLQKLRAFQQLQDAAHVLCPNVSSLDATATAVVATMNHNYCDRPGCHPCYSGDSGCNFRCHNIIAAQICD